MAHEFIPGTRTESGYDECDACGLLVDPEVTTWITLYCIFKACTGDTNRGSPCVMVDVDGRAICSYCDREGGSEDDAGDEDHVSWLDEALWPPTSDDDDDDDPDLGLLY